MKTCTSEEPDGCLGNIFLRRNFTYSEYAEELLAFQNAASNIVLGAYRRSHR